MERIVRLRGQYFNTKYKNKLPLYEWYTLKRFPLRESTLYIHILTN